MFEHVVQLKKKRTLKINLSVKIKCASAFYLLPHKFLSMMQEREFFGNQILWEMFRENMFTQSLVIWTPYLMVQSSNELSDQDSE